jgi:type IV pilus assembly protein PilA
LIELMMVVAIISVLAAVAIPAFMKYTLRSKTVEAVMNLRSMYDGAVSYYVAEHVDNTGAVIPRQFPSPAGPTPATMPGHGGGDIDGKHLPSSAEWATQQWAALDFMVTDPYRYQYSFLVSGANNLNATVQAQGDLNGNNVYSTFQRNMSGLNDQVTGNPALYSFQELE